MSMAEINAAAAAKTSSKRRPAAKCSTLVRNRDMIDRKIKAIERKNAEDMKREKDKILKRHDNQHRKVDAERDKALAKLEDKYGKACTPRKPRSDKGNKKATKRAAANDEPAESAPAARTTAKKAAKKAAKRGGKKASEEPAAASRTTKKATKKATKKGARAASGQQSLGCDGC